MPRNSSGVYSLPAGNPVVPGTTIDSTWANTTLEDLANEITNSLSRTGAGGMLAPFRVADGNASVPGLAFTNETTSGLYRIGAAEVGLSVTGSLAVKWTASGMTVPVGKTLTVAGTTSLTGTVNATGALNASDLNAVHIDMDTASASANAAGRLKWNANDGTLDIGMAGGNVTQQVGLEQYYHVRASSNIAAGEVVMSTGTLGASGRITAAPAVGNINPEYVMGVATESIASGADGYITSFGLVRDINTTGGGEAWTDGTVLYFNPNTAGGLTKTVPTAPNPKVVVAIVVRAHATTGSLFIRVTHGSVFGSTDSNVEFTALANNNMIKYNASASRWENVAGPAGAIVGTTDSQTLTNKTISGGTVNGASVINLSTPINATDAATKAYVDSVAEGLDAKASCVVATTANITLSGTQTIDGVSISAGERVLVKDQTNATENGIYVCAAGGWARSSDANTWSELVSAYTFVERGATQANNGYVCTVVAGGTLGVTNVTWSQFSAAGLVDAGAGLTKTGNTLAVGTASTNRIVVNPDNIDLASGVIASPGTYRSVTVDTYGRVTAGTNPTTIAGYAITDAYTKTEIDSIFGSTTSAAASASAAATSASNAATSASNAASSASSALSYLNTFRAQYLGASATDPTVDGNGNALTAGDLYYNTAVNEMRVYSGSAWLAAYLPATGYLALSGGTMTGAITFAGGQTFPGVALTGSVNTFTANQAISANTSSDALKITQAGSGNALYVEDVAADATPFVVSATGVVGIGTTTPDNVTSAGIALVSNDGYYPQLVTRNKAADTNASYVVFDKDRAGAVVQSGDNLGNIVWRSFDGTNYVQSAAIIAYSDATPGANDAPGAISFLTTADGASSPTERLKLTNAGTAIFRNDYQETTIVANTGTGYTINLANGTVQILTLTGNCTFTFPTATAGKSFMLLLKQDATGSRTVTWPAAVKWPGGTAPTITATASKLDKYVFTADGTNWYGSNAGQNYTV